MSKSRLECARDEIDHESLEGLHIRNLEFEVDKRGTYKEVAMLVARLWRKMIESNVTDVFGFVNEMKRTSPDDINIDIAWRMMGANFNPHLAVINLIYNDEEDNVGDYSDALRFYSTLKSMLGEHRVRFTLNRINHDQPEDIDATIKRYQGQIGNVIPENGDML